MELCWCLMAIACANGDENLCVIVLSLAVIHLRRDMPCWLIPSKQWLHLDGYCADPLLQWLKCKSLSRWSISLHEKIAHLFDRCGPISATSV